MSDILTVGRRYNNSRRNYLLIDPLQGKHIPVSPKRSLSMMRTLGKKLSDSVNSTGCIIGFAETATAIAAAAAANFPEDTFFITTTRENISENENDFLYFSEVHSHASAQKLYLPELKNVSADNVVIIDDEYSTGNTLRNLIDALRSNGMFEKAKFTAGSVLNRMDNKIISSFESENIFYEYIAQCHDTDFETLALDMEITAPIDLSVSGSGKNSSYTEFAAGTDYSDVRKGIRVGKMNSDINDFLCAAGDYFIKRINSGVKVLVLGTEEFMYPSLMLGENLEENISDVSVFCHSTTRSPIGIGTADGYPIRNGYLLRSFYENERPTYIYNTAEYDIIIAVTDSRDNICVKNAMEDITGIFSASEYYLVRM